MCLVWVLIVGAVLAWSDIVTKEADAHYAPHAVPFWGWLAIGTHTVFASFVPFLFVRALTRVDWRSTSSSGASAPDDHSERRIPRFTYMGYGCPGCDSPCRGWGSDGKEGI